MKSVILTITVLLGLLLVPTVEMKRKRCHKRPTVVECPDPLTRTCDNDWLMTVTTKDKYVGDTGTLNCSAGFSLIGNPSITCLESGVWSPINATCVPDDFEVYVRGFRGSIYTFVDGTQNYKQAKESCSSMCGTLVEINNKEENLFILSVKQELGLGFTYIGLESKNGNNFEWPSGNMTESNLLDNWNPGQPDTIEVGSCVVIRDRTWYDGTARYCGYAYINFICESRFD